MSSPVQAIAHAFGLDRETLEYYQRLLAGRISHVHASRIRADGVDVPATARILQESGFGGSFTIEFTLGNGDPDERPERQFENACRDLELLRGCLDKM